MLERLESRTLLDGYFGIGLQIVPDAPMDIGGWREFGQWDTFSMNVTGNRTDSDGATRGSDYQTIEPQVRFDHRLDVDLVSDYERVIHSDFLDRPFGTGLFLRETTYDLQWSMRQADGLADSDRWGSYAGVGIQFGGDLAAPVFWRYDFAVDESGISGTMENDEGESEAFAVGFNVSFGDGFTTFVSSRIGYWGEGGELTQQTDFDRGDGTKEVMFGAKLGYDLGLAPLLDSTFSLSFAGPSSLASALGTTGVPGQLFGGSFEIDFHDDGTFEIYDARQTFDDEHWDPFLGGSDYDVVGDRIILDMANGNEMTLRLSASGDSFVLDHFVIGGEEVFALGNGTLLEDFSLRPNTLTPNLRFAAAYGGFDQESGEGYIQARGENDQHVAFNLDMAAGIRNVRFAPETWIEDGEINSVVMNDEGEWHLQRAIDGLWSKSQIPRLNLDRPLRFGIEVGDDGSIVGAFVVENELEYFQRVNEEWETRRMALHEGVTADTVESVEVARTAWGADHVFYVDQAGSMYSTWTAPGLSETFTHDLSEIADADEIESNFDVLRTPWGAIHLNGSDRSGDAVSIWWHHDFGGDWAFTHIAMEHDLGLAFDLDVGLESFHDGTTGNMYTFGSSAGSPFALEWNFATDTWSTISIASDSVLPDSIYTLDVADDVIENGAVQRRADVVIGALPTFGKIPVLESLFMEREPGRELESLTAFLQTELIDPVMFEC